MTQRHNHYEAAFEAFVRAAGVPYVAIDEAKRARMGGKSLKSLDFIVSPVERPFRWLVDVKGRRFGGTVAAGRRRECWKNWSTRDDIESLARWQALFGPRFVPLLAFVYEIVDDLSPLPAEQLFAFRSRLYAMVAIRLDHYTSAARIISPKWGTLAMPRDRFRELARPLSEFFLTTGCRETQNIAAFRTPDAARPSDAALP